MVFIVEVWDKTGSFARKQYIARSLVEASRMAQLDLIPYPRLYIRDIWPLEDEPVNAD